jgi:alpha-L-fucosidase
MRTKIIILMTIFFMLAGQPSFSFAGGEVETDPLVLKKLEWFQDQKFGLFIHWGINSQWGSIESWPLVKKMTWARPDDLKAWTDRNKDFELFVRDYRALNKTFNPKKFAPEKWAKAAKAAGMKYIVFTTKHHDGFSMFDTKQTNYRVTDKSCPFNTNRQADIVKSVFDAFRKEGLAIGTYYSKSDWHHPSYWDPKLPHTDRNVNYDTKKYPEKWAKFVRYTHGQIEELMKNYGPVDILWLDGGQVRPPKQDIDMPGLAAMARSYQPGLLVVDRSVGGRYENYRTPEQQVPEEPLSYTWESCITMGDQWAYKQNDYYKSARELIHLLVGVVAKGGNLLLNIGPDADGQFPQVALDRLEEIAEWMSVNAEAIHGTRPIAPYKTGRFCLTSKGDTIYAIYLVGDGEVRMHKTITLSGIQLGEGSEIRLLGYDKPLEYKKDGNDTIISSPESIRRRPPSRHAWVFKLTKADND